MKKVFTALFVALFCVTLFFSSCKKDEAQTSTAAAAAPSASQSESTGATSAPAAPSARPTMSSNAADSYPSRNVTVINPWAAGGGTDSILRAAMNVAAKYGLNSTVENRTGGGGAIGHNAIRTANPDGYTIGMITFELNSLPQQGLIDFTYEDFAPVALLNRDAAALTVKADSPWETVQDFVDYAKAHPGEVTIGNSAPGSVWHIGAGLLADATGIEVVHVPFEGAATAVTQLAGGHIDAVTVSLAEVKSQLDAGNVKVLGVMADQRDSAYPDIPTFKEQGLDIEYYTWRGIAAPKDTDPAIIAKLEEIFKQVTEDPEFLEMAKNLNQNVSYLNAADFKEFLAQNFKDVTDTMISIGIIDSYEE